MMNIGQVCIKTAGRDAGLVCAIIDVVNENFVMIDGATRRRKCNVKHLEPSVKKIEIERNASHESVVEELRKLGFDIKEKEEKKEMAKEISEKREKPVRRRKSALKAETGLPQKKEAKKKKEKTKKSSYKEETKTEKENNKKEKQR